jgi:hypothetical protein
MKTYDIPSTARRQSAVVSRAQLARSRGWFERSLAGLVLLVSYLGTVFVFAGGVAALLADPWQPTPWLAALLVQGLLTALQWWYKQVAPLHPVYCLSLACDMIATVWGYGWVVAPPLALWLLARGAPEPALVAWLIVALASGFAAWYPERTLVD